MDNPQSRTDELLTQLNKYNYSVDSLQVLAWTELNSLRQDKKFTEKHREIIRQQKLTKLEEVGYVLQLIGDLNKDQSKDFNKRIESLEVTKGLLEKQSRKLREQIRYTDSLLEQVVEENAALVEKLRQKGLSEKEFKKQLKQQQQIDVQDDTVQRLQTALENANRELDIIHKSRSPTPSLSEELANKGFRVPKIVLEKADENPTVSGVQEDFNEEVQIEDEETALDLIAKTRIIIINARKAGSRGYIAETKLKKFDELARYKERFDELVKTGRIDTALIGEFNTLIPVAQEILSRRSPSPREEQNIDRTNPLTETIMSNLTELLKNIAHLVPIFYGTGGTDLGTEARKFIEGCMLAKENLGDNNNTLLIIKCIKTRLCGGAYTYLGNREFSTVESLCEAIKNKYLISKTLAEIQELIVNSKQLPSESAFNFGERIESLLQEAKNLIKTQWGNIVEQKSMLDYCNQAAVRSFIRGLQDSRLMSKLIGHENENLSTLLQIVRNAQNLLGPPPNTVNVFPVQTEQPLQEIVRQLVEEVRNLSLKHEINNQLPPQERQNRNNFTVGGNMRYGGQRNSHKYCGFCKRTGHSYSECSNRRSLHCNKCRQEGHTDRDCPRNDQTIRSQNVNTNQNLCTRGRRPRCYKCNQEGHYSYDCPIRQRSPRPNLNTTYERTNNPNSNRNNSGNSRRPSQN